MRKLLVVLAAAVAASACAPKKDPAYALNDRFFSLLQQGKPEEATGLIMRRDYAMLNTFKAYDDPNGARFRQIMLSAWKGMKYKIGDSYQGMAGYPSYEVTVDMVDIDAIIMSVGSFASIDEAVNYAASDKAPRRTRTMNTQTYLDDEKNWKLTFSGIDQLIGLTPY